MKFLVIPAYEPDNKLIELLKRVQKTSMFQTIVVDDGSGDTFGEIFAQAENYSIVLRHNVNKGKGAALKTAFSYIKNLNTDGVIITADSDGQHGINDIIKVARNISGSDNSFTTGVRRFTGKVPLKSKFGNTITKYIYFLAAKQFLTDTQCGLRAFPMNSLDFLLSIKGERYEYEMNMLLLAKKNGFTINEVPIETIYIDGNSGSHFKPLQDAIRIYKEIFGFMLSSLVSFFTDYAAYSLLSILFSGLATNSMLIFSNIGARLISSTINFNINKKLVFKDAPESKSSPVKYFLLAAFILGLNTGILLLFNSLTEANIYILKLFTEVVCFSLSFLAQKFFVFKNANLPEKNISLQERRSFHAS